MVNKRKPKKLLKEVRRTNANALLMLVELIQNKREILEKHLDFSAFYHIGIEADKECSESLPSVLEYFGAIGQKHACGTTMCLAGFSAVEGTGLLTPKQREGWMDYTARVFFGTDKISDINYGTNEVIWDWLFGCMWVEDIDLAIARIQYVVKYDRAPDFYQTDSEDYVDLAIDHYKEHGDFPAPVC